MYVKTTSSDVTKCSVSRGIFKVVSNSATRNNLSGSSKMGVSFFPPDIDVSLT